MQNFDVTPEKTSDTAFELVKKRLGHSFARRELLDLALTHSSWANEYSCGQEHNERQEFLGDAVLELCVSWEIYKRFPSAREGELTKMRSNLVSAVSLAERARDLGLDVLLKLGRGEENQGGRKRDAVLSDALEAVLAAVYEDGGFAAAEKPQKIIKPDCRKPRSSVLARRRCIRAWPVTALSTPRFLKFLFACLMAASLSPAAAAAKKLNSKLHATH